jgi:hypothetical protein
MLVPLGSELSGRVCATTLGSWWMNQRNGLYFKIPCLTLQLPSGQNRRRYTGHGVHFTWSGTPKPNQIAEEYRALASYHTGYYLYRNRTFKQDGGLLFSFS